VTVPSSYNLEQQLKIPNSKLRSPHAEPQTLRPIP